MHDQKIILTSLDGQTDLPRYFAAVYTGLCGIEKGRIDLTLPDGRRFRAEGPQPGPVAEVELHSVDVLARLIREGDLGFADAYIDGDWSTPDLQAFMDFIHESLDDYAAVFPGSRLLRLVERVRFWFQRNTKSQARKNISYHYDLGNDFYGEWLDDTMTYSSAIFESGQESLEAAQEMKYASMVDQMGAVPGDHVLEIGCGWGGFAEYAASKRGLKVTGLTISEEQFNFARNRIEKAGLSDLVEIKMQDYRDERGRYDGIASIEMFEAVGERFWGTYFDKVKSCLKPGRNATLQIITVAEERWKSYRRSVDFIQKYIFPGGMLPSPDALRGAIERSGLSVARSVEFGESYSLTLKRWHETFNEKWDKIARMGFDGRFKRMWDFYLTSCAALFHSGQCDVTQITVTRPAA